MLFGLNLGKLICNKKRRVAVLVSPQKKRCKYFDGLLTVLHVLPFQSIGVLQYKKKYYFFHKIKKKVRFKEFLVGKLVTLPLIFYTLVFPNLFGLSHFF